MSFYPKRWTGLGLGVALLGVAGLAGCGGEAGEAGETGETALASTVEQGEHGESGEQSESSETGEHGEGGEGGEAGEGGESAETLSLPKRLAFMTGHVEAGLALYRAGEPGMGAKHLLHPVSETHANERVGLDALGFDGGLFETVSATLDAGTPASEIEPQLALAEANLAAVTEKAGGDTVEIIEFLMDTIDEEYATGVPGETVEVAGEYQDAFGFAVVARDRAQKLEGGAGDRVRAEIDKLLTLWPEAPVPPADPTPTSQIIAQTGLVRLELSDLK